MRILIATLTIVFAISILIVAFINYNQRVTFTLWPESPEYVYQEVSLAWIVFWSVVTGIAFTGVVAVLEYSRARLSIARLRSQVRKLQQEILDLKMSAVQRTDRDLVLEEPPPREALDDLDETEDPRGREGFSGAG